MNDWAKRFGNRFGDSVDYRYSMPSAAEIEEFRRKSEAAWKMQGWSSTKHFRIDLDSDPDFKDYPLSKALTEKIQKRIQSALESLDPMQKSVDFWRQKVA